MRTFAFVNQKGGVGKTTVCLHVGAALAKLGERVLIVDLDPQATASAAVGLDEPIDGTMSQVMVEGRRIGSVIQPTKWGFDAAPSSVRLARMERAWDVEDIELLRHHLGDVKGSYDVALIDAPPNLGIFAYNALTAADGAVIVTQAARAAVNGIEDLADTFKKVRDRFNAALRLAGVIVNLFDARTNQSNKFLQRLEDAFGAEKLFSPPVRKLVVLEETIDEQLPLYEMAERSQARALASLFEDFARRILADA